MFCLLFYWRKYNAEHENIPPIQSEPNNQHSRNSNVHQKNNRKRTTLFKNKFLFDLQNNGDKMLSFTNIWYPANSNYIQLHPSDWQEILVALNVWLCMSYQNIKLSALTLSLLKETDCDNLFGISTLTFLIFWMLTQIVPRPLHPNLTRHI